MATMEGSFYTLFVIDRREKLTLLLTRLETLTPILAEPEAKNLLDAVMAMITVQIDAIQNEESGFDLLDALTSKWRFYENLYSDPSVHNISSLFEAITETLLN